MTTIDLNKKDGRSGRRDVRKKHGNIHSAPTRRTNSTD
jgi:hypothetical protein